MSGRGSIFLFVPCSCGCQHKVDIVECTRCQKPKPGNDKEMKPQGAYEKHTNKGIDLTPRQECGPSRFHVTPVTNNTLDIESNVLQNRIMRVLNENKKMTANNEPRVQEQPNLPDSDSSFEFVSDNPMTSLIGKANF